MLVLSDLHGAASVRNLALKFIVENGKEIVAQDGWRDKLKVKQLSFEDDKLYNIIVLRCTQRSWRTCSRP